MSCRQYGIAKIATASDKYKIKLIFLTANAVYLNKSLQR